MRFVRKTVTLPEDLEAFVLLRVGTLQHAGNLSSYLRGLIIEDRDKHGEVAA